MRAEFSSMSIDEHNTADGLRGMYVTGSGVVFDDDDGHFWLETTDTNVIKQLKEGESFSVPDKLSASNSVWQIFPFKNSTLSPKGYMLKDVKRL